MNCLLVTAHPLHDSLCAALSDQVSRALRDTGHDVTVEDLYANGFDSRLTAAERRSYYQGSYDSRDIAGEIRRLLAAEAIVLCFPTWWFGFPAILKGWFDRVWAPGVAYDHASDFGPIKPRLLGVRRMMAVTSLGSPWWVDRLILRQPVRRILRTAILQTCAPNCKFEMLSLYKSERLSSDEVERFSRRVRASISGWR